MRGQRAIVSGGADGTVGRWNPTTLEPMGDRLGPIGAPVTDVAVSADGAMLAASTQRGDVARWTSAGRSAGTFMVTNDTVWALAFGPHDTLAAAAADETLSLWSLTGNGKPQRVQDLASHRGGALDVAFVDPETVAVTAGDGRVRLWDVTTGASLGAGIEVTLGPLRYLATAPDGTIWTADPKGLVSRIDALVLPAACEAAAASFDARQEERLLGNKPPLACTRG
jgi:WD40 repeat protein